MPRTARGAPEGPGEGLKHGLGNAGRVVQTDQSGAGRRGGAGSGSINFHANFHFMEIRAKNSFTNKVDPFPASDLLRVYICGPTVYNSAHLGHARTYLTFDIIRRILEQVFGKTVVYQMNITDIDDKIITRSNEQGVSASELAKKYEAEFFRDMDNLGVQRPTAVTRVTECMPSIIAFVQQIMDNGYAYMSNGSVYFDTQAFAAAGFAYPKLRYITQES